MPERPEYLLDRDRAQRHAWKQERRPILENGYRTQQKQQILLQG